MLATALAQARSYRTIAEHHERVMFAARIALSKGDPDEARRLLDEQLGGYDGPAWNGTETGMKYLERARREDDKDACPDRGAERATGTLGAAGGIALRDLLDEATRLMLDLGREPEAHAARRIRKTAGLEA